MRSISLILLSAMVASCSTAAEPPMRSADAQAQYQRLIAGKIAGPPVSCLQTYRAGDMTVIDENTVIFRRSANQVYVGHMQGGCGNLGVPGYALLTKQFGGSGLCHGDIAQVVDTRNGMTVGSCVIGDFVPYTSG